MKTTILQNDQEDFKEGKFQIEMDFTELGAVSSSALFFLCYGNTKLASLSSLILSKGNAKQREALLLSLNSKTKGELSICVEFIRQVYNAREIVQNHAKLSQPSEPKLG